MLTDIPTINQKQLSDILFYNIKYGHNLIVFGPSGGGKTAMVNQAAKKANTVIKYCNLAVNERPDIQGWPRMNDSPIAEFKTPHYIPLPETRTAEEISTLTAALVCLEDDSCKDIKNAVNARLSVLNSYNQSIALNKALPLIMSLDVLKDANTNKKFVKKIQEMEEMSRGYPNVVLLFDEADKAPHDVLQPLLEILQFRTLNGRPLAIGSCILTCNLPDENAQTESLSHAITNRCFIYKLELDFAEWRKWAFTAETHPLVIGFLSQSPNLLHQKPSNNDDTAYAHPSPRAWADVSTIMKQIESEEKARNQNNSDLKDVKYSFISGKVGESTAVKFIIWTEHYRVLDPVINDIAEEGKNPDLSGFDTEQKLVLSIGVCSRLNAEFKDNNNVRIEKLCKNVFKWIKQLPIDIQTAGIRNALDPEKVTKSIAPTIPDVMDVFKNINQLTNNT